MQFYPTERHPNAAPGKLAGCRVLVVEDDEDARDLIQFVLASEDAIVRTASTADDALAHAADFKPDIVVSDVGLPGHDGYWLVREIHERWPDLKAIALSAFARAADVQRCYAEGFARHLPKPVEPETLVDAVAVTCAAN